MDGSLEGFKASVGAMELCGVVLVVLMAIWTGHYREGFAWTDDLKLQFNWHPMLMTFGMIFFYGNGMVVYRFFRKERKKTLKVVHTVLMAMAFILAVIALKAVFDTHNLAATPIANMYTLHSWIGLTAVILFSCQWLSGFITFLFPGLHQTWRAAYLPVHRFFGMSIFVAAVMAALTGLLEKAHWTLGKNYQSLPGEAVLINLMGMLMILFCGLVVYLAGRPSYIRASLPDEIPFSPPEQHSE